MTPPSLPGRHPTPATPTRGSPPDAAFIAGDWGTSHLRLSLCAADGQVLERRTGPGVAKVDDFGATLAAAAGDWRDRRTLPFMLCGMVGSNIGWTVVPYLPCPLPLDRLAGGAVRLADGRVAIAPGLSCLNLHGAPDRLRGEETQVLGALELRPILRQGVHLLCLPGTHTKWVLVDDGVVREFLSAVTGELFALIRDHSVLIRAGDTAPAADPHRGAFEAATAHVDAHPRASILHLLFEGRSRQISGQLSAAAAAAYASGLVIADEVRAALAEFHSRSPAFTHVTVIGDPTLTALYASVFARHQVECTRLDGAAASVAGLASLHAQLFQT